MLNEAQLDVLEKVKKLLKLAGNNSNAHEAALAAARAQELILRHKLESASLDENAAERVIGYNEQDPLDADGPAAWKTRLAAVLCKHNSCQPVSCRGETYRVRVLRIIGAPSNVATVRIMYAYVIDEINRLTRRDAAGLGRVYANNFRLGAVDGVGEKLAEIAASIAKEYAGTQALVLVNREGLALRNYLSTIKLGRGRRQGGQFDPSGRAAGRVAGRGIGLHKQVDGGGRTRGLLGSGQ